MNLLGLSRPIVKICGLTNQADAHILARFGASLAGFIFHPQSPRYIAPEKARKINTYGLIRVGVFVEDNLDSIRKIMDLAKIDLAQLHGKQGPQVALALGPERIIRVFWPERHEVADDFSDLLQSWKDLASMYLLDAGKSGGGHGTRLSLEKLPKVPVPWLLAGGLGPSDVLKVWPGQDANLAGLDFNSGLELSPGRKDPQAVAAVLKTLGKVPIGKITDKEQDNA